MDDDEDASEAIVSHDSDIRRSMDEHCCRTTDRQPAIIIPCLRGFAPYGR